MGKNKKASFNYIKERVWAKLQGWKEKLLSQARREVLLKAVVQAIPTFTMSCFKLLVDLCKEIEMQIRKFWWGEVAKGKSIGKVRKYFVNRNPREEWNSRIWLDLMRICWQIKFGDYKLRRLLYYIRCLALKYFPSSLVFEARSSTGSFAWQSLLKARHVIEK